jgi:fluoride exporter
VGGATLIGTPAILAGVLAAGALGAVARALATLALRKAGHRAGFATAVINLFGAAALGVVVGAGELGAAPPLATAFLAAFLGAFTTFSTWMHDLATDARAGRGVLATAKALGLLSIGVAAFAAARAVAVAVAVVR